MHIHSDEKGPDTVRDANAQGALIDIRASIMRTGTSDTTTRRKPRSPQGSDPYSDPETLRDIKRAQVPVEVSIVTKIETLSKSKITDSGETEVEVTAFIEQDACLLTVRNWDAVKDKETCLRSQIIPIFDTVLGLQPTTPRILQFLDTKGDPIRHIPSGHPKGLVPAMKIKPTNK
jgi:hypothetical protein